MTLSVENKRGDQKSKAVPFHTFSDFDSPLQATHFFFKFFTIWW